MNRNDLGNAIALASRPTRPMLRRMRFNDAAAYDAAAVQRMVMDGQALDAETRRAFSDSGLAYFVNELDRLDPQLVTPLYNVTWADDMPTITVGMGEESTSFIKQTFGSVGSQSATGLPWLNTNSNTLPGVAINGERLIKPLRPLGMELTLTEFEMARAQLTGRPIDTQKYDAMDIIYQLGLDQMTYIGDTAVGAKGLVNQPSSVIDIANVTAGPMVDNTPAENVKMLQDLCEQNYENTQHNVVCTDILLPPVEWAFISIQQMTNINETVLSYFLRTGLSTQFNGKPPRVRPCKWLTGVGVDGTDRMIGYSKKKEFVRFPFMPIRRLTTYHQSVAFHAPYVWVFGEVEMPRPETIIYRDNIGAAV